MKLTGNPVSPGIAVGPLLVYRPAPITVTESFCGPGGTESELTRLNAVKLSAILEIREIAQVLVKEDPQKAKIFDAHEDIINDEALMDAVSRGIRENNWAGDWALKTTFDGFVSMLEQVPDSTIKERVADLKDVCARLLRIWYGVEAHGLAHLTQSVVIAAHDLLPSDTATLDRSKVLAILTEIGGSTSHSAIIARSYQIPAVLGVPNLLEHMVHGSTVLVDALIGEVVLDPTDLEVQAYRQKEAAYRAETEITRTFLSARPITADGQLVEVGLNIGSGSDDELFYQPYADYVGLFRTEFLYMSTAVLPDEETQFSVYKKVLSTFGEKPVTLRTLDIGGDKSLECLPLPREDNPFLGNRALRLCFSRPDLFRTQLRAALRASVYGNLWLMLPMVSSIDDIRRAKEIIAAVHSELTAEGVPISDRYKVGIMIETPSIALISDLAACEVDFASIGTNDLCQYLMAVDRLNPTVSEYYQSYHPALFRAVELVAKAFAAADKPLSICGELGGDPLAAAAFLGMGIRKLSMGPAALSGIKQMISGLTIAQAGQIAKAVINLATTQEAEAHLKSILSRKEVAPCIPE